MFLIRRCWRNKLFHSSDVRFDIKPVNRSFMVCEMIALNETFAAKVALEPFASVPSDMSFQIIALREALVTEAALVRLLA